MLEAPLQGEGDEARDNWCVLVELDGEEVAGTDVTYVCFDGPELACDDGAAMEPTMVEVGARLRFTRVGDGVDTSSPPAIRGRELRVGC